MTNYVSNLGACKPMVDAPEGKQVGSLAQLKRFWIFLLFWMGFFNYLQISIGMIHLPQMATI